MGEGYEEALRGRTDRRVGVRAGAPERARCHMHDKDSGLMSYVIEGSTIEVFGEDGRALGSFEAAPARSSRSTVEEASWSSTTTGVGG